MSGKSDKNHQLTVLLKILLEEKKSNQSWNEKRGKVETV